MDDVFEVRLERRLARRNQGLKNQVLAWAELLDALGWCVAIRGESDGALELSPNAVAEMERRGLAGFTWHQLERELRPLPPGRRPVDSPTLQVWAFEAAAPAPEKEGALPLTPREAEVLKWLHEGKTNEEIAIILGCGRRTVEGHRLRLYRKLGVHTRAEVHLVGAARGTRGQASKAKP